MSEVAKVESNQETNGAEPCNVHAKANTHTALWVMNHHSSQSESESHADYDDGTASTSKSGVTNTPESAQLHTDSHSFIDGKPYLNVSNSHSRSTSVPTPGITKKKLTKLTYTNTFNKFTLLHFEKELIN